MKDKLKGCMMHQSDLWETPKEIYEFYCTGLGCFDPCPKNPEFNGLAEAKGMYICQYLNELEKMAAIFAWKMRELFRPLYDLELKNLHS